MNHSGSLVKEEREQIFKLFLNETRLRFSEIEKRVGIRSNMIAYHLGILVEHGLIEKKGDYYQLTKNAEKYMPVFPYVTGSVVGVLPVVLAAIVNDDKILLIKRNKRPYKGYWGMIGGKMGLEESFKDAALRLVRDKTSLNVNYSSLNAVLHERVMDGGMIKHGFILFFTKVMMPEQSPARFKESGHGRLKWFSIKGLGKEKVIPSDLWLIRNKLSCKAGVKEALMEDEDGELKSLKFFDD